MDWSNIIPVLVLVAILAFVIWRKWSADKGKEEVKIFLDSIADRFEGVIVDEIENLDFKDFSNLQDVEDSVLSRIYDTLWDIATASLVNYVSDPLAKMLITKYLTRDTVEAFVKAVFRTDKVQTVYTAKYNAALLEASGIKPEDVERIEKEVAEENAKIESEEVEPDTDPNWAETMDAEETKDVVLNPAHEEESEIVSADDNTIEEVD